MAMKEPPTPDLPESEAPRTGGFASFMPEDAEHAIEVLRETYPVMRCRELRFEPEHYLPPIRRPADQKR